MAESTRDISGLGLEELKALLVQALEANAQLKGRELRTARAARAAQELEGTPKLKPGGMEKAANAERRAGAEGPPRHQAAGACP
jgi:hypothetical protein